MFACTMQTRQENLTLTGNLGWQAGHSTFQDDSLTWLSDVYKSSQGCLSEINSRAFDTCTMESAKHTDP